MKMTGSLGLLFISAVLGLALSQTLRSEEPQPGTEGISSAGVNGAPEVTLPADINPNRAFTELVRLLQAGVEPSVILVYIDSTLRLYELDADDIIYLTDLGAPAEVITAAMEHDRKLIDKGMGIPQEEVPLETPPTEEVAEEVEDPPAEVTVNYFYNTLSPYGVWVDIDGYGRCWRPTVAVYNTGWQPYCDNGHWVYTNHGWYWASGYSWGRSTFHYGRWFRHARHGWCWWPDTYWAPSWVCWRYDRNYCGWAPLPPHTVYRHGVGFLYRGSSVAVSFNFGLNASAFTFVSTRDFCDPHPRRKRIDHRDAARIYDSTTAFHEIKYDRNHRRISNSGIPPRNVTAVTRQEIQPVSIRHAQDRVARGRQQEPVDRKGHTQTVNRPKHVSSQKTTTATTRSSVQRPEYSGTSKTRNTGQNSTKSSEIKTSNRGIDRSTPQATQTPQKQKTTYTPPQKQKPASTSVKKQKPTYTPPQKQKTTYTPPQKQKPTYTPPQKQKPTYTPPQKQKPTYTPRPQENKKSVTPPRSYPSTQVQKQVPKKSSSGSTKQVVQVPSQANNPLPSTPPKAKGSTQSKKPTPANNKTNE